MKRPMTIVAMACSLACAYASTHAARAAEAGPATQTSQDERAHMRQLVSDAARIVSEMKADPRMLATMRQAKGIFLVPNYGRDAFLAGGQGGEGVMVARNNGAWSNPVFYHVGGLSLGASFAAEGGGIAMLLMTDRALESFKQQSPFSLDSGAGISVAGQSARSQSAAGKEDIVLWSDARDAYAATSLGATDVSYDANANRAYYRANHVSAERILSGEVMNPHPLAAQLKTMLPAS